MIYCPKCGAANRDGSRFCNECGERLGTRTELKCPECGALNPVQNLFCDECGARLMPAPPPGPGTEATPGVRGLSLPTKMPLSQEDEPAATVQRSGAEEDLPPWLQELGASLAAESPARGGGSTGGEEQMPDWLRDLRSSLPPEPGLEGTPDQVTGTQPAAESEALVEPEPEVEGEGVPEWLAELRPSEPEVESEALVESEPEVEGEGVPDWLAEFETAAETEGITPPSETAPEWLPDIPATPEEEAELVGEELAASELPDWLAPGAEGLAGEALERADIPDWLLALKPQEVREEEGEAQAPVASGSVEHAGLLADLAGTLPAETVIAQPRAAAGRAFESPPLVETSQSRLFAEIVAQPLALAAKALPQRRPLRVGKLPLLIINLALLVAVALPLALGTSFLPRTFEPTPPVVGLYDAIEGVERGDPVLVAFDYDPTTSGEMDVIARSLVGHLADRQAQIVAVSLLPAGPATAEGLLDDMVGLGGYVNLGYLPGEQVAVRLLGESLPLAAAADFRGTPLTELEAMAGLQSLRDFALVIELAAAQNSLRWWIEQAQAPYDLTLGAGVSASVEPVARAYYDTRPPQLVGLVAGVPGAARYEAAKDKAQGPDEALVARLDAQLGGHVVLILVLLIGNGVYLVRRRTKEER